MICYDAREEIDVQQVWALRSADRRNLGLIPHNLNYFQAHFVGVKMAQTWTPPPVKVSGTSKKLRDFTSWMIQAPVVSEHAKSHLESLFSASIEFLPLLKLRGKQYYAVNVLEIISDSLDRDASDIIYSVHDPKRIVNVKTYHFCPGRLKPVPIFKIPEDHFGSVFVTRPFVDVVIASKLTGAKFADPAANPFDAIMKGESCNVVPGVWE